MQRRLLFQSFPILAMLVVFSFSSMVAAQEAFDMEKLLPANTLLYASVTDGKAYCEDMRTTGLWQLFSSDEWKEFFKTVPPEICQMLRGQQQEMEGQLGLTLKDFHNAFQGQVALAVIDVNLEAPMPLPQIIFGWDLGTQKEKFAEVLEKLKMQFQDMLHIETYEVHGQAVTQIITPDFPVFFTYMGSALVVCTDKNYLESIIDPQFKSDNPLATSKPFQTVKTQLLQGKTGEFLYFNVERAMQIASQLAPPAQFAQLQQILKMTGVDSLEALGGGATFREGQVTESFYFYTPKGRVALMGSLFPAKATKQDLVKFFPARILGFNHGFLDLAEMYATANHLFKTFNPRDYQGFLGMKQGMEEEFGINLEQDILGTLGNEYLMSLSCSLGLLPDLALQISLKDQERFKQALNKILATIPQENRFQVTWQGHEFTYFNFSTKYNPKAVAPAILVEDERLLVTLFPETLKNMLKGVKDNSNAALLKPGQVSGQPSLYFYEI